MVLEIIGGFVAIVLLVLAVAYTISIYNQLVRLHRGVDQAKQNIDVLLKRRQDELTKLIDATQEFMEHEEELLSALTEARERAEQARTPTEQASADQAVRDALAGFRARFEDYPDLRSQTNMLQFQERIADVESQIADRREFYNEAATRYNTRIEQFPWVIVAQQLGYTERELFTATDAETADVDIGEQFAAA